ncbi:hypothetical protein AVEN_71007-1 [Araneus ventricosus]|uniref:Brain-specific angiogenesis inhibitor 1-associated protein 2 n=1 Tax=Araneus ventricosus TaxID=182803 RepID=A0A4Y2G6B8_ARAVE|nr:hypothetical protein AVEN_71007-1 [Araneus ventricosus]
MYWNKHTENYTLESGGTALLQLVEVQKEIQAQQLNILKAFYVDLLVPLETNIDKDTKIVACEQKRFMQQHKCLQDSYLKAAAVVKKQRKKQKGGRCGNIDKEIKNLQQLEEEKMKLDCFCERSLKQAITQERRRFGFVLERQCSLTKHNLVYHSQGQSLLQHHLEEWEDIAKSRELLPEPIDKLFPPNNTYKSCSEYACANLFDHSVPTSTSLYVPSPNTDRATLRKNRSLDTSCVDLREPNLDPFPKPLIRAKSDFNIASSNASLISNDYGVTLRPKSLIEADTKSGHSRVRALYSYLSSGEHQLSFHEGDIITLIGDKNKGWQYGENQRNHRRGWFPIAYTAVLDDGPNVHPMDANAMIKIEQIITENEDATQGDGEDEGIYDKNGNTTFLDFFHLTTTKRYIRENRTVPTIHPEKHAWNKSLGEELFLSFFIITIHFIVLVAILVYIYKYIKGFIKEYSAEFNMHSSISSDRLTTVHRSSEQSDFFPEVHRPPTGRNQFPDTRRELCGEPLRTDLLSELDSNRSAADITGVAISFFNSASANYSHGRRESDDSVTEMPPDYDTVVLNDLTNSTKPDFPVVRRTSETPPPEYGKANPFLNDLL